ncbi:MAG: hypothetical protein ACK50P_15095, partial [Planctomycetaceae bacterium]
QLEQLPREASDPPLLLPKVTRLQLRIVRGIVELVSINGQAVPQFQGAEFNRKIDPEFSSYLSVHDLNLAGPFGVYVNDPRTIGVSLPQNSL